MQIDFNKFHPLSEKIVDILCTKVQNSDKAFFRVEVAYYLAKVASNMHTSIYDVTGNQMPVNLFAFAYGDSGYGKGFSQTILEDSMFNGFEELFLEVIYPETAKKSIAEKAKHIAHRTGIDEMTVEADLTTDFQALGDFMYGFPEGTSPALKQLFTAVTYAGIGAPCLEMDEIGYNIGKNIDVMATLLEMFDTGKTKDKLIKSTKDQKRIKSLRKSVPANVFAFGTPVTAFDGGQTEDIIMKLMKSGYGRRSFFAYGDISSKYLSEEDEETLFAKLTDTSMNKDIEEIHRQITSLASMDMVGQVKYLTTPASRFSLTYNQYCKQRASAISEYRPIEKAEMLHRTSKVMKLAGAYAFFDGSEYVEIHHLEYAIALAEESGKSLYKILNQPKTHVRLANFLCDYGSAVTQADLVEKLPFYSGTTAHKKDMISLAMAHGHRNAMAIKMFEESGVTMYEGEKLEATDVNNLIISHSNSPADNYQNVYTDIPSLVEFIKNNDTNMCHHHFKNGEIGQGNRSKLATVSGTNMVWFDVDKSKFSAKLIHRLMAEYSHIIYETKSCTKEEPRYRLGLVLSHVVKLDDVEYKIFAKNIANWLPVVPDLPAIQRERKYRIDNKTFKDKNVYYVDNGKLLDVMPYYPNTKQAEDTTKFSHAILKERIKGMERWVIHTATGEGNRNSTLYSYAMFLVQYSKKSAEVIIEDIKRVNSKLPNPLDETEIEATIAKSVEEKRNIDG